MVRRAPGRPGEGLLQLAHGVRRAAIGVSGIGAMKREGDGASPLGAWPVRQLLYRRDRGWPPRTGLPMHAIADGDGWSDDPADRNYNRMIRLPSPRSAEGLRREDRLYDLVLVLGYNDLPRVRGRGSAIFVHLARPGYKPTEGCLGLSRADFLALLREIRPGDLIEFRR